MRVRKEIRLEKWTIAYRLSRSLKVIGTNMRRSTNCDFLLMIHSNYGPISYWSKIEIFSFLMQRVFPFEFYNVDRTYKLE